MSFVSREDILDLIEEMYASLVNTVKPEFKVVRPFTRLTYADAMLRYATDKRTLRYGLEIADIGDIAARTDFEVFKRPSPPRHRPGPGRPRLRRVHPPPTGRAITSWRSAPAPEGF
jgi:aspartyl-tRNA synthetase